ncbi:hypothetical protein TIFTF001_038516 [Ficus carica]|uniref:Ubiquitin-like protease family profile domain-containing protein n=1 Tax=Ficus carica TaxID=3494 RepID=A0AA88EIQ3_FICCA|nr:hypothetical protein TIFTF001_038516 [Ficus carica]
MGGRDRYRKLDQKLGDFSEQQTQRSFKSMRTNDILTKSLGNDKHSGRTRGQSKFVRQLHYFNIIQSSRENVEVSAVKRQLAALERTVQELCAKYGINRKTMAEENTASTVDQHNSFKASCTQNEKEPGPSDPQPTPNARRTWAMFQPTVREIPLGEKNVRLTINVPKLKHALLPIPTNEATIIEEAVVQQGIDREVYRRKRANNILRILTNAPKGKLYLMPYNSGQHWILAVIDSWDDSIIYFNPLRNEPGDDFHDLIKLALNDWKILVGKGVRKRRNYETLINNVRCQVEPKSLSQGKIIRNATQSLSIPTLPACYMKPNPFEIIALSHGTPLRASETSCTLSGSAQFAQGPLLDSSTDDNREGLQESYHDDVENVPTGPIDIAELPSTTPEAEETISDAPASVANVEDTNALAPASEDPTAGNNGLEDVRVSQSCETLENPVTLGDKADKKNLSFWSQAPNIHAFLELFETGESRGPLVENTVDHSGEITLFKGVGVPLETVPFPEMAFA